MQDRAPLANHLRRLVADDSVMIGLLAAVAVATILAYGFEATLDIVVSMLVLGAVTALAETRLRANK